VRRRRARHLGELAAAVVDGELDHDARDRALAHIANCESCRHEVDVQRRLKRRLHGLSEPAVNAEFLDQLVAAPPTPRRRAARRRPGRRPVRPRPLRRPVLVGAASGGVLAATALGVAFAVGGTAPGRPVVPPVSDFVREHVATTVELPLGPGPAVGVSLVNAHSGRP
jgi:anti-sigma factor RsiW